MLGGVIEPGAGPRLRRTQGAHPRLIRRGQMRCHVVDGLAHSTEWAVSRDDHGEILADTPHLSHHRVWSTAPLHLPTDQVRLRVICRAFSCLPSDSASGRLYVPSALDRAEQERTRCSP